MLATFMQRCGMGLGLIWFATLLFQLEQLQTRRNILHLHGKRTVMMALLCMAKEMILSIEHFRLLPHSGVGRRQLRSLLRCRVFVFAQILRRIMLALLNRMGEMTLMHECGMAARYLRASLLKMPKQKAKIQVLRTLIVPGIMQALLCLHLLILITLHWIILLLPNQKAGI